MRTFLHLRSLLAFAATLLLALPVAAQQANVRLPDLGSGFDTVMPPHQAAEYGAEFLHQLRAAHLVLDDPQVHQYINELGYRLAAASPDPTQRYTFTLLNVPEINSFATFGGYIFIFSRMFTITQNQSELAAVMAHELAHISQHHLQQQMEERRKSLPLYLAGAILAGIAASHANTNSCQGRFNRYLGYSQHQGCGDTGFSAAESVLALMQQHEIDYTRADEAQADHIGINTLAKAGFNPEGMANIFAHMQALIRPGGGMAAGNMPGFLQNHPVSSVRIAGARARAHVLEEQMQAEKAAGAGDLPAAAGLLPLPFVKDGAALFDTSMRGPSELQYELMRERVRVLASGTPRSVLKYYRRNMAASEKFAAEVFNRYGYALALVRTNDAAKAVPIMTKLSNADPGNLTLALGLADTEYHAGQRKQALKHYAQLNTIWPNDPAIVLEYSRVLLDGGNNASAKTAQTLLKPLLGGSSEPSLYAAYGHACHVAGDEIHASIAYADATFLSGSPRAALGQLQRLLKNKSLDYYTRAKINARIAQITPIVLELRRRHRDLSGDAGFREGGSGIPGGGE